MMVIVGKRNILWAGKRASGWLRIFSLAYTYYTVYSIPSKTQRFLLKMCVTFSLIIQFLPAARVCVCALERKVIGITLPSYSILLLNYIHVYYNVMVQALG